MSSSSTRVEFNTDQSDQSTANDQCEELPPQIVMPSGEPRLSRISICLFEVLCFEPLHLFMQTVSRESTDFVTLNWPHFDHYIWPHLNR
jgi:hypothetical protein